MNFKHHALAALTFILILLSSPLYALGSQEKPLETANFLALGTTCAVSIYGGTDRQFSELETLITGIEDMMSVKISGTEIGRINAAAGTAPVAVSNDVFNVITAGLRFSELSGGAFDISIGPLVSLWDIGGSGSTVPSDDEITAALGLVDYNSVQTKPASAPDGGGTVYLPVEGMALEPGGIAKGYAADAAAEYMADEGIKSALINLGGNVFAIGAKADGSAWRIGIQNPDDSRGSYIGIVSVTGKAVVTSGKYERFFIAEGIRYHHILSTTDGFPVENGIAQVSIISDDSMTADAMSTTVFSLGLESGLALAEKMDDLEAIIVLENGDIHLTGGLVGSFKLTDSNFKIVN